MVGLRTPKGQGILLVGLLALSVMVSGIGAAATGEGLHPQAANDSVDTVQERTEPSVSIVTQSIDDSTQTTLRLKYDPGQHDVSDLKLILQGPQTETPNDGTESLYETATASDSSFNTTLEQSGGTLSITFEENTFGGGPVPVTAKLVKDGDRYTKLTEDSRTFDIPSTVSLTDWSASPATTTVGEDVTVTATLTNTGDSNANFTVVATTPDRIWDSKYVTVDAGSTRDVSLTVTSDYPRDLDLSVAGEGPNPITFEPVVAVENRSVNTTSATTGEDVTLSAEVHNTQTGEASRTIDFNFGDTALARDVTVAEGERQTVSVTVSTDRPGRVHPRIAGEFTDPVEINSRLAVTAVETDQSAIDIGDSVEVTATLENPTTGWVNETIPIEVNGDTVTRQVAIPSGETRTVSGVLQPTRSGSGTIQVAGVRTETDLTVNSVLQIVEGSVALNRSTVPVNEDVTVNFTYRNPSDSGYTVDRSISIYTAGASERIDVSLPPGETKDVNVTLTPDRAESQAHVRVGSTEVATIAVESPVVVERIDYDHEVAAGETATVTYELTNTDQSSAHSRLVDVYGNTNDGDSVSASETVDVSAGETKTVSLDLQMETPGDYHLSLPGGREGGIGVLNDTDGEANLTVDIRETNSVSLRNEARFFVNVSNTGTADGAKLLTLRRDKDGPVIEEDAVLVGPGQAETGGVAMEFESPGDKTVYINGQPMNITVTEPYVLDTDVSVANGTVPDRMPVLEGGYDRGYLNIELRINERRASSYDLSRIGADKTTRFKLEMTVRDFDPNAVIATGQNIEWEATTLSENETKVTLYVNPVHRSYLEDPPSLDEWNGTQRTATFTIENFIQYRVYGDSPDSSRDYYWANGLALSTNAQRYSAPRYYETENGSRFEVVLAAPHFRADGSLNTGHYTAHIPDATLDEWGVDSPSDLKAAYTGANDTTVDITETPDGMRVTIDLHYSSGTVNVGEASAVQSVIEAGSGAEPDPDSGSDSRSGSSPGAGPGAGTAPDSGSQTSADTETTESETTTPAETETETESERTTRTDDNDGETSADSTIDETDEPTTTAPPATETARSTPTSDDEQVTSTGTPTESASPNGEVPGFGPLITVAVIGLVSLAVTLRARLSEY